jgi:hypothetical protein
MNKPVGVAMSTCGSGAAKLEPVGTCGNGKTKWKPVGMV